MTDGAIYSIPPPTNMPSWPAQGQQLLISQSRYYVRLSDPPSKLDEAVNLVIVIRQGQSSNLGRNPWLFCQGFLMLVHRLNHFCPP